MANSLEDLNRKLAYLGKQASTIAGRAALAAIKTTVPAIKSAARSQIGLKVKGKSISLGRMVQSVGAARMKNRNGIVGAKAGVDVGKGKTAKRSGHGHLFISGTVQRKTGSVRIRRAGKVIGRKATGNAVQNRGRMPAHSPSFVTAGAKSSEAAMKTAFAETLAKGIDAAIQKGG